MRVVVSDLWADRRHVGILRRPLSKKYHKGTHSKSKRQSVAAKSKRLGARCDESSSYVLYLVIILGLVEIIVLFLAFLE